MVKNIFFIGPASVGKSTTARLLADQLGYAFIDIDEQFCKRIALIPDVVKVEGYAVYCEKNSTLTDDFIRENPERTVFATPSGFLVHEDSPHLIEKHLKVIQNGISILLLPDEDPQKGVDVVVARQLARWSELDAARERERFLSRFEKYKNYGDIKIFSMREPHEIVALICNKLPDFY